MKTFRNDLVYPELSYKIIGILFHVYNEIGCGYQEKQYQRAIAATLQEEKMKFKEQLFIPVQYKNVFVGRYYIDFLIEEKVVLEIKQGDHFLQSNIKQVYNYLQRTHLKLGILANFTSNGVIYKRILNIR